VLWGLTVYQLPFKAVLKIGGIGAQPQKKRFAFSGVIGIAIALFGIIGIGFVKLALAEEGNSGCGVDPFYLEHSLLCAKPQFGIDIGATRTQFEEGHGDKMLNRNQHPINFFFGFNTTENFGIEVGYGETRRKHKQVNLGPGEFAPGGDPINPGEYQVYDTNLSTSQPYISLRYKHPLGEKLQFLGAIGITAIRIHASWENIEDDTQMIPPAQSNMRSRFLDQRKIIPIVKIGLYYPLIKSFSLRFVTTWLQGSKLQVYIAPPQGLDWNSMNINKKDDMQFSIGIVYGI